MSLCFHNFYLFFYQEANINNSVLFIYFRKRKRNKIIKIVSEIPIELAFPQSKSLKYFKRIEKIELTIVHSSLISFASFSNLSSAQKTIIFFYEKFFQINLQVLSLIYSSQIHIHSQPRLAKKCIQLTRLNHRPPFSSFPFDLEIAFSIFRVHKFTQH